MSVKCPYCGNESADDVKFCTVCGAKLTAPEPKSEEPANETYVSYAPIDKNSFVNPEPAPQAPAYQNVSAPAPEAQAPAYQNAAAPSLDAQAPAYQNAAAPSPEAQVPSQNPAFSTSGTLPGSQYYFNASTYNKPTEAPAQTATAYQAPTTDPRPAMPAISSFGAAPMATGLPKPITPKTNTVPANQGKKVYKEIPAKFFEYLGLMILFALPGLGFIFKIIFTFAPKKKSLRNFSGVFLFLSILGALLVVAGAVLIAKFVPEAIEEFKKALEDPMNYDFNDYFNTIIPQ